MKAAEMTTPDKTQDAAQARPRARRLGAWLRRLLPLVLLLVALAPFRGPLQAAVKRNLANRPYLLAAMRAAGGDNPAIDGLEPANGVQARALAYVALRNNRPGEGLRWLLQGVTKADPATLTRFEICRLLVNEMRIAEARNYCRGAVSAALAPTAYYWLSLGIAADEQDGPEAAIAYFDMARTADPSLLSAWERLGRAAFRVERYSEAVEVYEHLLTVQARPLADTFYQLGLSYLALDRPDDARRALEQGLEVYPYQRELHLALADTARAAGDLATADAWYARLLQQRPSDAYAWAARGEVAMQRGLAKQAVSYMAEATSLQPADVGHWLSLATAAAAAGDRRQAIAAYDEALALRPADVNVLLAAAAFFAQSGQTARARALYQQVLALEPGNSVAAAALAAPMP